MSSPVPSADFQYYGANYWNDLPVVAAELRRRAADGVDQSWGEKLLEWNGAPFAKALSLNCGSGWVERELVSAGVVASAIGVDISEALLAQARVAAVAGGLDIAYQQVDTNTATLDFEGVDLVVNYAAMHHVARIDRVMRQVCELLPEDGALVSWDYIGPHRNQYPAHQWETMWLLNATLPLGMRKNLCYPHLPTMLATDPTEAIHSELIMSTMRRYFHLDHVRYLGGALAYELLCFNDGFFDGGDHTDLVRRILDADAAYMSDDPEPNSLFVFVLARPNKAALLALDDLQQWAQEEEEREAAAADSGGKYYPDTMLGDLYVALEAARRTTTPDTPPPEPALVRRLGSACKRRLRGMRAKLSRRA